jgi:hypothetical protein
MLSRKMRRPAQLLTVGLAALAILIASAEPAAAADGITFDPSHQTVEYGQSWQVEGTITPESGSDSDYGSLSVSTGSTTENLGTNWVFGGAFTFSDSAFNLALGVGTHSINASFSGGAATAASSTPTVVTITPAAILTTTTITPDPNNSQNAIITSQLSGQYIDQLPNCECEAQNGYLLPAGTWKLAVTDSSGKTVFTKQLDQAANGLPTFVNYWPSIPAGETFSAQSTFTIAGGAASNFTMSSQKFSWTSGKTTGPGGAVSPSNTPRPKTVKTASFAPPLLVFYAALLVAIILIALDVLLFVFRRRSRRTPAVAQNGAES